MEIFIKKKNGSSVAVETQAAVSKITKAEQRWSLMAEDVVQLSVESITPVDFMIGDSVTAFGKPYYLNALPQVRKNAQRDYVYELQFESVQYELTKVQYMNEDVGGVSFSADFSLTGGLRKFLEVLVNNCTRVFGGGMWQLGNCPDTDYKTLSFSQENCLSVLQRLCEEFGQEFTITTLGDITTIDIQTAGQVLPHRFTYGRGNGLYNITRKTVSNKNIITRLYAFGANKNLRSDYRGFSPRLKMAVNDLSFIEDVQSKAAFGVIEAVKIFEDIFPHRTGRVSALGANELAFADASMDFDLNEKDANGTKYLIAGTTAKIHFNTGNLAGYEFEIEKYDHAAKTFKIIPFKDERGAVFPNKDSAAFRFGLNDEYVLLDIMMPQTYIDAAEANLLAEAQKYLAENCQPRVQYDLTVDDMYLNGQAGEGSVINYFVPGDYLSVSDGEIGVDKNMRIKAFTRDMLDVYKYSLELSDIAEASVIQRLIADNADIKKIVTQHKLDSPARARNGWRTTQELLNMVFDQSGYFDTAHIKPASIETQMLAVGNKPQQFVLQDIVIEANFEGDKNRVQVSAGALVHYTIAADVRTWNIASAETILSDSGAYYIYARCERVGDAGVIIFSTNQIRVEDDGGYYHFLIGVLHSVDTGTDVRWISLTYGASSINGRFIKTGRVQSADGYTYFDLDESEIGGRVMFKDGLISGLIGVGNDTGVKAGISGDGNTDEMVRFWAGDTIENRATAPYRVLQSGEVMARKRIEVEELGAENKVEGQAGLCGSNNAADGDVRMWAGKSYEDRNTAPFRVTKDGKVYMNSVWIDGGMQITEQAITNGQAWALYQDFMSIMPGFFLFRKVGASTSQLIEAGLNSTPATLGYYTGGNFINTYYTGAWDTNIAIRAEASGAGANYALYAGKGVVFGNEFLINGRKLISRTLSSGQTLQINRIADYEVYSILPTGSDAYINFADCTTDIKEGAERTFINMYAGVNWDICDQLIIKGLKFGTSATSMRIPANRANTIIFSQGKWWLKA